MRLILTFVLASLALIGSAQFKVDPQKVPIVSAKRRALIIGASNFEHLGKLDYASSDAEHFRDALLNGFKFTPNSIRFISDSPTCVEKPNSATITKALNELLADPTLDKGDLFILFFSGHGMGKADTDYFCATDTKLDDVETTGLPVKKVIETLKASGLRNILIIADACRAGEESTFGNQLTNLARKTNIAVLLGCEPGKKSYEAPALHSGVFTYFLLKSLSNPKNRTESGGLWTSQIATSIESSVFEYTKHDYGDNAQRPTAFADPTSDVMLAKFVDASTSRSLVDAGKLNDPLKISDELAQQVPEMLVGNDYLAALEAAKQALALDSTNYYAALYASYATIYLGRNGEHEKYCDMLKKSDNPYFKNLGYVQSESRQTSLADRLRELESFWNASPKDEVHAGLVWGKATMFAPSFAVKVLLEKMLPDIKSGRLKTFFEGEIARENNQLELALAKYQAALALPIESSLIQDEVLIILQFPVLRQLQRNAELMAIMDTQLKKPVVPAVVWVTVAANLKALGQREQAINVIKKYINDQNLTEDEVLICAKTMGASVVDIADALEAQVKLKPYSWKVRTAASLATGMKSKDAKSTEAAFETARKYCDDDLEIISLAYSLIGSVIDDAEKNFNIPSEKFADQLEAFHMLFLSQVQSIGDDSEKWQQLGELGLAVGHGPQTMRLVRKYLKDFNARSSLGSEFYTMLFQLATTTEDDDVAKFAAGHPSLAEPDRSDMVLLYSTYLISRGNYGEARNQLKTLKTSSEIFAPLRTSVDLVLKARTGDLVPLKKFMQGHFELTEAEILAEGIGALALSDLNQNDEAFPHLEKLSSYISVMVSSVSLRCVERYIKLLKAGGKTITADEKLFQILQSNQISPAIKAAFFGSAPGLNNFVGSFKAEAAWFSDEMFDEKNPTHESQLNMAAAGKGKFDFTVAASGIVSGEVSIEGGRTFVLTGKVDDLGNLQGSAVAGDQKFLVEAKLLSQEFRKTEAFKKSNVGQIVLFTNDKGLVTRWLVPFAL